MTGNQSNKRAEAEYYRTVHQRNQSMLGAGAGTTAAADMVSSLTHRGSAPILTVTPDTSSAPSSASSVTSSSGSGSGNTSGSESDVSSLAAAAAANANRQAAAMAAAAAQAGAPAGAAAASLYGCSPQAYNAAIAAAAASAGHGHPHAGAGLAAAQQNMLAAAAGMNGLMAAAAHPVTPHHPIAEFLYQLTKMLTDDNSTYIEWRDGRIHVHDPQRLADEVLHKYFRHSKYASFQRQLNYFGFKKIAGKGKMSPCSYVNDAVTDDIRSLLFIKRKTNSSKAADARKAAGGAGVLPVAGKKRKAASASVGNVGKRHMPGQKGTTMHPSMMTAITPNLGALQQQQQQQQQHPGNAPAAHHPYAAALAQQQALLAAKGPTAALSTGAPGAGPAAGAATAALTSTETLHFPNEAMLNNLISTEQFQQHQLQQQQQQFQQHQLQQQQQQQQQAMPCPATMAMNAASASGALAAGGNNGSGSAIGASLFGSSANLASLLKTDTTNNSGEGGNNGTTAAQYTPQFGGVGAAPLSATASSAFLSSLPSSNTLFPDNLSSLSLNRLLNGTSRSSVVAAAGTPGPGGAGRVPSMLGLSGFLSRENSLLDLAMGLTTRPSAQQLQALGMYMEPNPLPDGDAAAQILG